MAMAMGADIQKAFRAGLLHDCAKGYSIEQADEILRSIWDHTHKRNEKVRSFFISALAPYIARDCYGNEDAEIASAVECHTTGKPGMSLLDKIIFVPIYRPGLKNTGLSEIRRLAFSDIDRCLLKIIENTMQYLKSRGSGD